MIQEQISIFDLLNLRNSKEEVINERLFRLAKQYDKYEVVSAFHKELRRGNEWKALYWGLVLTEGKSKWYPMKYMTQVSTEESHTPELKTFISKYMQKYKTLSDIEFASCIHAFCKAPQKWAVKISDDMWWYESVEWDKAQKDINACIRRYEPDKELVKKWEEIVKKIGTTHFVKGLYWNYEILALIEQFISEKSLPKLVYMTQFMWHPKEYLPYMKILAEKNSKVTEMLNVVDHDLVRNHMFLFDLEIIFIQLCGFGDEVPSYNIKINEDEVKEIVDKVYSRILSGKELEIPLYALDIHTRRGKKLWYAHRNKLVKIGQPVKEIDLRYTGDWIGTLWRRYAYLQHGTILVPWESVWMDEQAVRDAIYKKKYYKHKYSGLK